MGTTLHFAHIYIFLICLVLLFVGTVYRLYVKKEPTYMYPLGSVLKRSGAKGYSIGKPVLFTIRMICLFLLAMLAGKLQIADNTSKVSKLMPKALRIWTTLFEKPHCGINFVPFMNTKIGLD